MIKSKLFAVGIAVTFLFSGCKTKDLKMSEVKEENSKEHKAMKETLENITRNVDYVSFDKNKLEGTYIRYPERNELTSDINESLVVEFYNK